MIPVRIICHHSLTKDSGTVSWGAIRRYHVETLGWLDIGYHAGVELVQSGAETYFEVLMGRMWDVVGAHTRGQNHDSLGLLFVGNYDYEVPPEGMLLVGAKVVKFWMKLYGISIDDVYNHRDFAGYKSCPGELFSLMDIKELVIPY